MVIAEAMNIGSHHFTFEGDESADQLLNKEIESADDESDSVMPKESQQPVIEEPLEDGEDMPPSVSENSSRPDSDEKASGKPHIAGDRVHGRPHVSSEALDTEPAFEQPSAYFWADAEANNALATHDLGRMYADGLGAEKDAVLHSAGSTRPCRISGYRCGEKHRIGGRPQPETMSRRGAWQRQDLEEAPAAFERRSSQNLN